MAYLIHLIKAGITERRTIYIEVSALDRINRLEGELDLIPVFKLTLYLLIICGKAFIYRVWDFLKWIFWVEPK